MGNISFWFYLTRALLFLTGMGEGTQLFNSSAQTHHRLRFFSYTHLQESLEKAWAEAGMRNAPLSALSFSFSLPVLGPCSQACTKQPPQSSLMRNTITAYRAALKNAYFSHRSKYQLKLSLKFCDMKQMREFAWHYLYTILFRGNILYLQFCLFVLLSLRF